MVMRVGELAMAVTDCNIQQSGPCTSPGQQNQELVLVERRDMLVSLPAGEQGSRRARR